MLFANGTTIGIKFQRSGDLFTVFIFRQILSIQLLMDDGQRFLLATATENSVMSDTHETFRKNVQRKSPEKFHRFQSHDLSFTGIVIILVMKGYCLVVGV